MTHKGECSKTRNAQRAKQSKKKCLIHFRPLHTLLEDFSKEDLTNACFSSGFHRAFSSLFGEDVEYFAPRVHDSMVNEITMQTREGMIRNDASEIDNNVAGSSHDKDNIPESSKELQQELTEEVQEMLNMFESMESKVDRTSEKNKKFQNKINQLLEANISNDVRNLVMLSYVEIKNNEELERFSKESKDSDKFCNDVVEVKEKLSKRIVQVEKDFAKLEVQNCDFQIALQHKTQENSSLKTLQKENENLWHHYKSKMLI
ncbi:hypothetical protein Tco_1476275 [Tanacetum coccineum]